MVYLIEVGVTRVEWFGAWNGVWSMVDLVELGVVRVGWEFFVVWVLVCFMFPRIWRIFVVHFLRLISEFVISEVPWLVWGGGGGQEV